MGKADQQQMKRTRESEISGIKKKGAEQEEMLEGQYGEARAQKQALYPQLTSSYGDIMATGGYDPAVLGNLRDVYSEYTKTGGVSEAEAGAMRSRAHQAAIGAYDVSKQEAQRIASATGGYGDTSAATQASLARKGSQAAERATIGSDAEIARLRQGGRLQGAAGMTGLEQSQVQNKLSAAAGMSNIYGLSVQEASRVVDQILDNYRTTGQLTADQQAQLQQLANMPGVFDKIMGAIGTIGGAAGGVMGGLGMLGVSGAGVPAVGTGAGGPGTGVGLGSIYKNPYQPYRY